MKEVLKKSWAYVLYETDSRDYLLSVLCGTVAHYEIEIELTSEQMKNYEEKGEKFIDELASKVRSNPQKYFKPRREL